MTFVAAIACGLFLFRARLPSDLLQRASPWDGILAQWHKQRNSAPYANHTLGVAIRRQIRLAPNPTLAGAMLAEPSTLLRPALPFAFAVNILPRRIDYRMNPPQSPPCGMARTTDLCTNPYYKFSMEHVYVSSVLKPSSTGNNL